MRRISAIFIAVCMVLIAGSIGAVLYLGFKVDARTSAIVALAALTGMALYNAVSNRLRDRGDVGDQIADLSRGTADLARQVAEISRRLVAMESRVEGTVNRVRGAVDPIAAEIGELGGLVRQIAETVASHAAALQQQGALPASAEPVAALDADGALTLSESDAVGGRRFRNMSREGIVDLIGKAVDANRIDLYLQPIVTLPQRKVRYYEALSRLRTDEGDIVTAADFIDYAESVGLMPKIDNLLLFRCVQVTRRLQLKSRDVGLFCNVSASTLSDPVFFRQFLDFMDANRALSNALMFEFTQSAYRALRAARARKPGGARRTRLPLLHGSCHRPAHGAEGIGRPLVPLPQSAGQAVAQPRHRVAERHPSRRSRRPAGALRHRSHRRAHRKREHGGRPARLRRALRPRLPVFAAAAGARRGLAGHARRSRRVACGGRRRRANWPRPTPADALLCRP